MSDFTEEFTKKVQESVNVDGRGRTGSSDKWYKKIDKRWFVIGALLLVFVVVLVILLVVKNTTEETTVEDAVAREEILYEGEIVGNWICDDNLERDFRADLTYMWFGGEIAESGTYEEENGVLKVRRTVYYYDDNGRDDTLVVKDYNLKYGTESQLTLEGVGSGEVYQCKKVES